MLASSRLDVDRLDTGRPAGRPRTQERPPVAAGW